MITEDSVIKALWTLIVLVYAGVTGHQYSRIGAMDAKIDKHKERLEDTYVSKETFLATVSAIHISLASIEKNSEAQTRAIEKLFSTKTDKL